MSNEPMSQNITILPQIEDLLYPLKPEELAHLEASIRQHGVREPLCLWDRDGELILVDGHNRYAVATRNGVTFPTTIMEFKDLDDLLCVGFVHGKSPKGKSRRPTPIGDGPRQGGVNVV